MTLTILVPAHNEQENIAEVIDKIESALDIAHDLVVVNDHSSDATVRIVTELTKKFPNLRLIHNPDEAGFANTLKAGINSIKTDLVVPVMGDLCDDLSTIKVMLARIIEGYDVVCGCRYTKGGLRLGGSRLKGFLSFFGGWSIHFLLGIPTLDITNAFKMYRKKVIDSVEISARGFDISMEIPLKAFYQGFKITDVPTVWRERTRGKSSFKIFKLLPSYIRLYLWAIYKRLV